MSNVQLGLRKKSSTALTIVYLVYDLHTSFYSKIYSVCLFLLFTKLQANGIRGSAYSQVDSYFSHWDQPVLGNDKQCDVLPITGGVPEGSVMDPYLFILFLIMDGKAVGRKSLYLLMKLSFMDNLSKW